MKESKGKRIAFSSMVAALGVTSTFVLVNKGYLHVQHFSGPAVFPRTRGVMAQFEFNGDANDVGANRRDGVFLGGEFVQTTWGGGLHLLAGKATGIDWSAHASLLASPYTIEVVLTPRQTLNYAKIFSFHDSADEGWYYREEGITVYPHSLLAPGRAEPGKRHYIAFVSPTPGQLDIYFQGEFLGRAPSNFPPPPQQAIFFRDDSSTGRGEQLDAVVEALRISNVARSPGEIAAIQRRLEKRAGMTR